MVDKDKPESRLARHRRVASEIIHEPRSAGGYARSVLVAVWIKRGAGFYGLGWILAFIAMEINLFTSELAESDGVVEFVGGQVVEYLLRVSFMSFINTFLALLWPIYVMQWFGGYGIILLVAGYFAFEKLLRPVVERTLPELAAAREQAAAEKAAKAAKAEKTEKAKE